MAKLIKYNLCCRTNLGTDKEPAWEEILSPVEMGWNETNEEIAKREAYNGAYTVVDDGVEAPTAQTQEERIAELEEALYMLLNGVVV